MKHKKLIITLSVISGALLLIIGAFFIYVGDYYKADGVAIEAFNYEGFTEKELDKDGTVAYIPNIAYDTGIIFYPGGKVEHTAYSPLMQALSSQGVLCVLVEMPFNLAVFDINGADGVCDQFDSVEHWYMAGHSLGGSMACSYIYENAESFEGIILLASYSTKDLSNSGIKVLTLYGTEDKVLNREKYDENKNNLPSDLVEYVIEGGNHAYFGTYGEQKGDGKATVTNKEQVEITANKILRFVK